jgi:glycosyltransferase involved in cell wall biosynthesis
MGKKHGLAPEGKRRLIKNGVDIRSLIHSEELGQRKEDLRVKFKLSPPVIGTVARLHRQKGILYLLRAAKEIHGRHPEATIVVVGGGPLEESLRRQAAKLELGRNFLMLGERTDAREILSLFDIFVLPSLWEGLPLVLIEAAALGKPMIATDIDGVREVIRNGENGILVPPRDPAKLAESVIRLIEDPSLASKLGVNAEKEIPHLFPLSRMVEKTQQLYLELTKKTRVDP